MTQMTQIKHNPKTVGDLLNLHKSISEKLDAFNIKHPEMLYNIDLFIGENSHTIIIDIKVIDAGRVNPDTETTGGKIQ